MRLDARLIYRSGRRHDPFRLGPIRALFGLVGEPQHLGMLTVVSDQNGHYPFADMGWWRAERGFGWDFHFGNNSNPGQRVHTTQGTEMNRLPNRSELSPIRPGVMFDVYRNMYGKPAVEIRHIPEGPVEKWTRPRKSEETRVREWQAENPNYFYTWETEYGCVVCFGGFKVFYGRCKYCGAVLHTRRRLPLITHPFGSGKWPSLCDPCRAEQAAIASRRSMRKLRAHKKLERKQFRLASIQRYRLELESKGYSTDGLSDDDLEQLQTESLNLRER